MEDKAREVSRGVASFRLAMALRLVSIECGAARELSRAQDSVSVPGERVGHRN